MTAVPVTAVIVFVLSDGTVGRLQLYGEPTDERIQAALDKMVFPGGLKVIRWRRTASVDDFPHADAFKGAWRDDGEKIYIDMPKAREIDRDLRRAARAPLLKALDVEAIKALASGDQARLREVETTKQALRDVTADPAIEAAQTPEALKLVWPAVLTETPA